MSRTPNKAVAFSIVSSVQHARHIHSTSTPWFLIKSERFATVENIEIIAAMAVSTRRKESQTSDIGRGREKETLLLDLTAIPRKRESCQVPRNSGTINRRLRKESVKTSTAIPSLAFGENREFATSAFEPRRGRRTRMVGGGHTTLPIRSKACPVEDLNTRKSSHFDAV